MTVRIALAAFAIIVAAFLRPQEEGRPPRRAKTFARATLAEADASVTSISLPDPLERARGEAPQERVSADPPPSSRPARADHAADLGRLAAEHDDVARGVAETAASTGSLESRYEAYRALAYAGREGLLDPELRKRLLREYERSALARR